MIRSCSHSPSVSSYSLSTDTGTTIVQAVRLTMLNGSKLSSTSGNASSVRRSKQRRAKMRLTVRDPRRTVTTRGARAGKRLSVKDSAKVYLATRHPDYPSLETPAVLRGVLKGGRVAPSGRVTGSTLVRFARELQLSERRDAATYELIELVGPDVLFGVGGSDNLSRGGELAVQQFIRARNRTRVEDCYWQATEGSSVQARRRAAGFLRGLGAALAGDRRGRRTKGPRTRDVRAFYCRMSFRLQRARDPLRVWPWPGSQTEKIRAEEQN